MAFDPIQYKTTTHQQWEDAAEAWHRWGPTLESWLAVATERMLDAAGVTVGSRVLDVAAGAGGQSIVAARRVGTAGVVVATDISLDDPDLRGQGRRRSRRGEPAHPRGRRRAPRRPPGRVVRRRHLPPRADLLPGPATSAQWHPPRPRAPAVGSRRSSTRPPLATSSSRSPCRSSASGPSSPRRSPASPDRSASATRRCSTALLTAAGFHDVTIETVSAPLRLPSASECVRFEQESFGALHQMLAGVADDERSAVWADIEHALSRFETDEGFAGPCELLVAGGAR